jgi:hypothetical protein
VTFGLLIVRPLNNEPEELETGGVEVEIDFWDEERPALCVSFRAGLGSLDRRVALWDGGDFFVASEPVGGSSSHSANLKFIPANICSSSFEDDIVPLNARRIWPKKWDGYLVLTQTMTTK